jgi:acetyl-CoA carboxylase biotin carboxylase subunit
MFRKILIANRGEVALRIIRACRELGIRTVAVYSEADADSLHVRFADEHVCIGPAPSAKSYLNIPALISAAEVTDVDAIHPGYGFLSENAHFAEVCGQCKLTFIGPSPEAIRLMGDKAQAKRTAMKAKVPVVPGSDGAVEDPAEALTVAKKIGYPVFVKAVAGGGGRGMRLVMGESQMANAFLTARNEAQVAFGNPGVYVEKFIENPKHIEIQVLGDLKGNAIHLGERDCSVQRRHQKLIEEAPSPVITQKIRDRMGDVAVNLVKTIGYVSAGTIEFLYDQASHRFFFMEMNTRIQVEHPVTEYVTNIDLIKEQIIIAGGNAMSYRQREVHFDGHSIECRINAEDPARNFMPCPGLVTTYHPPGGPGVRVDSHIYTGYRVPSHYDSMIAKVIVRGHDRREAIRRMLRALDECIIEGIATTIPFHRQVLTAKEFVKGTHSTKFLETFDFKSEPAET